MGKSIYLILVALAVIVVLLRATFLLTLIYLVFGVVAAGRFWSRKSLEAISVRREFTGRAFIGDQVPVKVEIANRGLLPVVWLQVQESLPIEVSLGEPFRSVLSMGPKERLTYRYVLEGRRRGYFPVGPLSLFTSDLFGVMDDLSAVHPPDYLIVYPKIIPLTKVSLPASSPMGALRHKEPVFEDPSRVRGKRDYTSGDSLRSVDWKASASTGKLQVKLFEPSIELQTAIFLNLNTADFSLKTRFDAPELAIIVAASLATWVVNVRQTVGLFTNGADPLLDRETRAGRAGAQPIPPRAGRAQLMRILDLLARVQPAAAGSFLELLRCESQQLSWGTTLLVLTPQFDTGLFDELFRARRAGLNAVLLPCGNISHSEDLRRRAYQFGFPLFQIQSERDLDVWRR